MNPFPEFNNSRCAEILNSAFARNGEKPIPLESIPDELKAIAILTVKAELFRVFPEIPSTIEGRAWLDHLNSTLAILAPSIFDSKKNTPSTYNRMTHVFISDLKDLRNGNLSNPPL